MPIVVVFTKFDLYMERLQQDGLKLAEILFKKNYDQILEKLAESMACQIPYALVTSTSVSQAVSFSLTPSWSFAT